MIFKYVMEHSAKENRNGIMKNFKSGIFSYHISYHMNHEPYSSIYAAYSMQSNLRQDSDTMNHVKIQLKQTELLHLKRNSSDKVRFQISKKMCRIFEFLGMKSEIRQSILWWCYARSCLSIYNSGEYKTSRSPCPKRCRCWPCKMWNGNFGLFR